MKDVQFYLDKYSESHLNPINKIIHWVCVPAIVFSIMGLLWSIPMPSFIFNIPLIGPYLNVATVFMVCALLYYLSLSFMLGLSMIFYVGVCFILLFVLEAQNANILLVSILVFVIAWIGQFIGHAIEGAKPSFIDDIQYLLIGPIWLMSFIYKKLGIKY